MDFKKSKKLQAFFKNDSSSPKRVKSLLSYLSGCQPDEKRQFHQEYFSQVYSTILDALHQLDIGEFKDSDESEIVVGASILQVLIDLLNDIREHIQKRWQYRSISNVIESALCYNNIECIRIMGLKLLLTFVSIIADYDASKLSPSSLSFIGSSINMIPFCTKDDSVSSEAIEYFERNKIFANDAFLFAKIDNREYSKNEALNMFCVIFDFVLRGDNVSTFPFWMETLKNLVFIHVYPTAPCYSNVSTGIGNICHSSIQAICIPFFQGILASEELKNSMNSDTTMTQLLLEVFRQSFSLLGGEHSHIVKSVISVYTSWVHGVEMPHLLKNEIDKCLKMIIETSCFSFQCRTESAYDRRTKMTIVLQTTVHSKDDLSVLESVVYLLKLVSRQPVFSLTPATWEFLIRSLISSCHAAVSTGFSVVEISTDHLRSVLVNTLFDCLFDCYTLNESLWESIQLDSIRFIQWKPFVGIWKSRLSSLTHSLIQDIIELGELIDISHTDTENEYDLENKRASFSILFGIWDCMLHSLGNPNKITDGDSKKDMITGLAETLSIFLDAIEISKVKSKAEKRMNSVNYSNSSIVVAEAGKPKKNSVDRQFLPRGNTLFQIFGPWLLEAIDLEDSRYIQCNCQIFHVLCRLFISRFDEKWQNAHLFQFYKLIHKGLTSSNREIKWTIVSSCSSLFSLGIEGSHILIPYFIKEIQTIISLRSSQSDLTRRACISMIFSLISLPSHYGDVAFPSLQFLNNISQSSTESLLTSYKDLRAVILDILLGCLQFDEDAEMKSMSIWGICLYLHNELDLLMDSQTARDFIVMIIRFSSMSQDAKVAHTAIEAIRTLSTRFSELDSLDAYIVDMVFRGLISNANEIISFSLQPIMNSSEHLDKLLSNILYCILDWIMSLQSAEKRDRILNQDLFKLLYTCIENDTGFVSGKESADAHKWGEHSGKAARSVILHLTDNFENFPLPCGPDFVSSPVGGIKETDETTSDSDSVPESLHLVYRNEVIFSVSQTKEDDASENPKDKVRVIVRNASGRFAWDFRSSKLSDIIRHIDAHGQYTEQSAAIKRYSDLTQVSQTSLYSESSTQVVENEDYGMLNSSDSEEDQDQDQEHAKTKSTLEVLLGKIDNEYEADIWVSTFPKNPEEILRQSSSSTEPEINELIRQLSEFKTQEESFSPLVASDNHSLNPLQLSTGPSHLPKSILSDCRLLLAQLGFVSTEKDDNDLCLLENSSKLDRSLRLLDGVMSRECHKIGVIYVREGQETQSEILKNDSGSESYERLINGIGWPIDVSKHSGFLGGLDPRGVTGKFAPYFSSSTVEMIFHVVSRMPTNWTDRQQIHKKRQVGNDHVHIVWSDSSRDYVPSTISSSFNDAHIVIYPLPDGLFRIQVFSKDKVPPFGPLLSGMVVREKILANLIRITAMNANRAVRYSTPGYDHPYPTRQKYIKDLVSRHQQKSSSREIYSSLFPRSKSFQEQS